MTMPIPNDIFTSSEPLVKSVNNPATPPIDPLDNKVRNARERLIKEELDTGTPEENLQTLESIREGYFTDQQLNPDAPTSDDAILASQAKMDVRDVQVFPDEAKRRAVERSDARQNMSAPLSNYLLHNKHQIKVLENNFKKIDNLHNYLNNKQYLKGDIDDSFLDKISTGWQKGKSVAKMAYYKTRVQDALMSGNPIPNDVESELSNLQYRASAGTRDGFWLGNMAVATAGIAAPLVDSSIGALRAGAYGLAGGAIVGSVIPGVGTISGGIGGFRLGSIAGFAESTYDQTYVPAAYEYSKMKVDGMPLDPVVVDAAATVQSVVSSGLDLAATAVLGAGYAAAGKTVSSVISGAIRTPEGLTILKDLASTIAASTGTEAITEATQELVLIAYGELAKLETSAKRGGDYTPKDVADIIFSEATWESMSESAKQAMMATPLLAGVPAVGRAGLRLVTYKANVIKSNEETVSLDSIVDQLKDGDILETQGGREVIGEILNQNSIDKIYIEPSEAIGIVNSLNQDGKGGKWLDLISEKLQVAARDNSIAEFDPVELIREISTHDGAEELLQVMTLSDISISPYNSENISNRKEDRLIEELNAAITEQAVINDIKTESDKIINQLKDTGMLTARAAKLLAAIIPEYAYSRTLGTNISAGELLQSFGLKIEAARGKRNENRGSYNLDNKTITLNDTHDLSTFLHETAHFFFDIEQNLGDLSRVEKFLPHMSKALGVDELSIEMAFNEPASYPELYVGMQEYFAVNFEKYLLEGKAPSNRLLESFRTYAEWMALVYKDDSEMLAGLDPDIAQAFSEFLVAPEITEKMENSLELRSEEMLVLNNEIEDYQLSKEKESTPQTEEKLMQKVMVKIASLLNRKEKTDYKKAKVAAKKAAGGIVDKEMANNPIRHAVGIIKSDNNLLLNRKEVKAILGVKHIPKSLIRMTAVDGSTISTVIETISLWHGIELETTPNDFITAITELPSRASLIKENIDNVMASFTEDYGQPDTWQMANESVRTEQQGRSLLKLLEGGENIEARKQVSLDVLYKTPKKLMRSYKFHRREVKAAAEYATAMANDDKVSAAEWAKIRLSNHIKFTQSVKIEKDFRAIDRRLKSLSEKKIMAQDKATWNKISDLLSDGTKELTVGQYYALDDSITLLKKQALAISKDNASKDRKATQDIVNSMVKEMDANKGAVDRTYVVSDDSKVKDLYRTFVSQMTIIPHLIKVLSNPLGTNQSVMQKYFESDFINADNKVFELSKKYLDGIIKKTKNASKDSLVKNLGQTYYIPSLSGIKAFDGKLKGSQLLAFVLNTGSQKNLQTLLEGYGIIGEDEPATHTNPAVVEVMSHLSKDDWKVVQSILDAMDGLFPKVANIVYKYKGIKLDKVEPLTIDTKFGKVRGGYYPLFKDVDVITPAPTSESSTDSLMSGDNTDKLAFNPSSTFERTKAIYPVSLDIDSGVTGHFSKVIHYISFYEPVDNARLILDNTDFSAKFQEVAGKEHLKMLNLWLKEVANPSPAKGIAAIDSLLTRTRIGMTLVVLGGSVFKTVPKQLLGLFNTAPELGGGNAAKGTARLLMSTLSLIPGTESNKSLMADMRENSKVMNGRLDYAEFDRDMKELQMGLRHKDSKLSSFNALLMKPIGLMQGYVVDATVWVAAKNSSLENSLNAGKTEKQALDIAYKYADSVVERTQGSGNQKSLPMVLRTPRNAFVRSALMFMTATVSGGNIITSSMANAERGSISKSQALGESLFIILGISLTLTLINKAIGEITGEHEEGDDEEEFLKQTTGTIGSMIPYLSYIISMFGGYGGSIPQVQLFEKGIHEIADLIKSDEPIADSIEDVDIKNVALLLGALGHVAGVGQAVNSVQGLEYALNDGKNEDGIKKVLAVMYGKPKDE